MKTRTKRILGAAGVVAVCYIAAYFLSVTAAYVQIKAVSLAVPVYRPCDAAVVHGLFAPIQLLDEAYLRPSRWQEKLTR